MSLQVACFKAGAARMQSSRVTTAPITLPGIFPHWIVTSYPIVVSYNFYIHYSYYTYYNIIHTREHPALTPPPNRCARETSPPFASEMTFAHPGVP